MIKALFLFSKDIPIDSIVIDTTSNSGEFRELSPFVLSAPPAKRFENLWQYSKVYPDQVNREGNPTNEWFWWRREGFYNNRAVRYPKGKGAIPLYSIYPQSYDNRCTEHLGYIEARKKVYASEYAKNVVNTQSYNRLQGVYQYSNGLSGNRGNLILLDYDAYDHEVLGMSLIDVINNPDRKMGHAFVLMMMLKGELEKCINS